MVVHCNYLKLGLAAFPSRCLDPSTGSVPCSVFFSGKPLFPSRGYLPSFIGFLSSFPTPALCSRFLSGHPPGLITNYSPSPFHASSATAPLFIYYSSTDSHITHLLSPPFNQPATSSPRSVGFSTLTLSGTVFYSHVIVGSVL
jgi:hypothetical protein